MTAKTYKTYLGTVLIDRDRTGIHATFTPSQELTTFENKTASDALDHLASELRSMATAVADLSRKLYGQSPEPLPVIALQNCTACGRELSWMEVAKGRTTCIAAYLCGKRAEKKGR
jgi:hypothetical protein